MKREFNLTVRNVRPSKGARPDVLVNGQIRLSIEKYSSTRNVYLLPLDGKEYILKVCRPNRWAIIGTQTEAEIKMWRKMAKEDRPYFIPLVSWGKTKEDKIPFVVQPFVTPDQGAQPTGQQMDYLYDVLETYRASSDVEIDCGYMLNFFMIEGRPRVYDWGCNMYTRRTDEKRPYSFERS